MSEPTVTRAPEPDGPTRTASEAAPDAADDAPPEAPPGYDLHDLVGSGGMGAVYRAHDRALGRDVAIKFLHARYAPGSVTARRFTEEARITARLAHPGIPPVHQVGALPGGRPFLAMKLINGQTLEDHLKARAALGDDRGRFVGVFEKVADAVGFAHSRRIIHRDLKPSNVMVGDFGEVQVMDWGLAKELGDARPTDARAGDETHSLEPAAGSGGADATQAGSLLGTPAFMPPEQALGAIDLITERSDVFGLGAILCVILTGKPPFVGDSAESTRVIAARGKLDDCFARLDGCGAEPELVALAKRCLAPEPADRPANAGEVASAVAAFRADAERRARQAETDRATAEVKATEERKRRRVLLALAAAVLGLVAVAGLARGWIDTERTRVRTEQEADLARRADEGRQRAADLKAHQLVTERDVTAALNEVQLLRQEGWKQADDPHRWRLTLVAARSAFLRAHGLLDAGSPTAELLARLAAAAADLDRDERDRALLAELDRITEENEVRFLIPIALTRKPSERYAAAFRAHGIDLVTAPRDEAVAWLKAHRFRQRLTAAVRNWQTAMPTIDVGALFSPDTGPDHDEVPAALAAVGGGVGTAAAALHQPLRERLRLLADAVTDDPFAREWWAAVNKKDRVALKRLVGGPELERLPSGELSSLADGLIGDFSGGDDAILGRLLRIAYERFPGEFWVNFRLVHLAEGGSGPGKDEAARRATILRHLNAAVAARPRSAIARVALGAMLLDQEKGDPTARRIVRGAAELDPSSPWPHILLAELAMDDGDWAGVRAELVGAVRADPDLGFLLASTVLPSAGAFPRPALAKTPGEEENDRIAEALIAARPEHPGGYDIRAGLRYRRDDYSGALADYHRAKAAIRGEYIRGTSVSAQIVALERLARWEQKLPAVLRGDLKPTADEYAELAEYCAGFERKYALAARFAGDAITGNPNLWSATTRAKFAGWAVRASRGGGTDAADLTAAQRAGLRQQALAWLRDLGRHLDNRLDAWLAFTLWANADLAPVREPAEVAKLPPEERIAWEKFWAGKPNPFRQPHETAPPPHEPKR